MILVHCWEEEEPGDMHLQHVVNILLQQYSQLPRDADVRIKSQEVSAALRATVAANVAQHAGQGSAYKSKHQAAERLPLQSNAVSAGLGRAPCSHDQGSSLDRSAEELILA